MSTTVLSFNIILKHPGISSIQYLANIKHYADVMICGSKCAPVILWCSYSTAILYIQNSKCIVSKQYNKISKESDIKKVFGIIQKKLKLLL